MVDGLQRARDLAATFRQNLSTAILGTASATGEPDASVVATLLDERGAFVIYVSGLTAHTRHLRVNPRASVLLVEPEGAATQAFARRRLTFACNAELVGRETAEHGLLVGQFRAKFGAAVDLLAGLPDFQLMRLVPQSGRLVAGFGAAFDVDPLDWSKLTPVGRPRGA